MYFLNSKVELLENYTNWQKKKILNVPKNEKNACCNNPNFGHVCKLVKELPLWILSELVPSW